MQGEARRGEDKRGERRGEDKIGKRRGEARTREVRRGEER